MTPTEILRVFSTFQTHGLKYLLMGGQACVLYSAAPFSEDIDIFILAEPDNLATFESAIQDLQAERIAVPPFDPIHLSAGFAIHFRCHRPGLEDLRLDVMSKLRHPTDFDELYARRHTFTLQAVPIPTMAMPDLVDAKKTQGDKDWPAINQLVISDYYRANETPGPEQIRFWLRELRDANLLCEACARFPEDAAALAPLRRAVSLALDDEEEASIPGINREFLREQFEASEADRLYWLPLRKMLEDMRRNRA